jgi:hypothetical protein
MFVHMKEKNGMSSRSAIKIAGLFRRTSSLSLSGLAKDFSRVIVFCLDGHVTRHLLEANVVRTVDTRSYARGLPAQTPYRGIKGYGGNN